MYFAECVIDGVLCWKSSPNGDWKQYTPKQLTDKLFALQDEHTDLKCQLERVNKAIGE